MCHRRTVYFVVVVIVGVGGRWSGQEEPLIRHDNCITGAVYISYLGYTTYTLPSPSGFIDIVPSYSRGDMIL